MIVEPSTIYIPSQLIHPGESLLEAIEYTGLTQKDIANRIGVSEKHLSNIINGLSPITPEMAIKLERSLGIVSSFWNDLQKRYEEALAYQHAKESLKNEASWLDDFECYNDLVKYGFLTKVKTVEEKVEQLLKFFGIDSFANFSYVETKFRTSKTKKVNHKCIYAWLRCAEIVSQDRQVDGFSPSKARELINDFRKATMNPYFEQVLIDLCAQAGIVLVFLPYFRNSSIHGAFRWYGNKPLIQLNARNAYIDIFWFSFFHELGHAILHGKRNSYLDLEFNDTHADEKEANDFASNVLIPQEQYQDFCKNSVFSDELITKFAAKVGISKAIVEGRLAHDGLLNWSKISSRPRLKVIQKFS